MELVLIAPNGYEHNLQSEIEQDQNCKILLHKSRFFWIECSQISPWIWTQNIWLKPKLAQFASAGEAAAILRSIHPLWAHHSLYHHRRAELITEKLPKLKSKALDFPCSIKFPPLGAFGLLEPTKMIFSELTSSPFADGEPHFSHEKINAPSRAHLKLWEFFTVTGIVPTKGSICLDMGAAPGGWTWVLSRLGMKVISVDRAELDEPLMTNPNIEHLKRDAFTLSPDSLPKVDWFFSDLICFPERLFELIQKWKKAKPKLQFVCTIKFKGPTDFSVVKMFQSIPGSKILHLSANKNEVTWYLIQ